MADVSKGCAEGCVPARLRARRSPNGLRQGRLTRGFAPKGLPERGCARRSARWSRRRGLRRRVLPARVGTNGRPDGRRPCIRISYVQHLGLKWLIFENLAVFEKIQKRLQGLLHFTYLIFISINLLLLRHEKIRERIEVL